MKCSLVNPGRVSSSPQCGGEYTFSTMNFIIPMENPTRRPATAPYSVSPVQRIPNRNIEEIEGARYDWIFWRYTNSWLPAKPAKQGLNKSFLHSVKPFFNQKQASRFANWTKGKTVLSAVIKKAFILFCCAGNGLIWLVFCLIFTNRPLSRARLVFYFFFSSTKKTTNNMTKMRVITIFNTPKGGGGGDVEPLEFIKPHL